MVEKQEGGGAQHYDKYDYDTVTALTSAVSCLLSTTRSGTLSKMERNFSTASSNLPTVVSW